MNFRDINSIEKRLKIKESRLGYAKLDDNTLVVLRTAVVDVKPHEGKTPVGVDFEVNIVTGVSVYPSKNVLEKIKDKPVIEPNKTISEGWESVKITEKRSPYEKVEFMDERLGSYLITVEVEPIMAWINLNVKTERNEPLYSIRWVPKIVWEKLK